MNGGTMDGGGAGLTFGWPWALLALVVVPLVVVWYVRQLRARAARRAALAAQGLVATARPSTWRRRVPAGLFLLALLLLVAGLARPEASIPEPRREGTVVLAFDVSGSMAATDLTPTRLDAAKAAATQFVERQPASVRIAVVAFGATGVVTQEPTADRASAVAAIDRLAPQGGTALGGGLQTALGAIVGRQVVVPSGRGGGPEPTGPDLGYHGSAAVVLLTDGENTAEPDPLQVADIASTAGVKVYPIGLGSPGGTVLQIDGFQVATRLDEPLLREIADRTDGRYFAAADPAALSAVYDAVELEWTTEDRRVELTALVAVAGALLLGIGAALSLAWTGRVV
ncbi:aerotolerance regulator BatA [Pseudonocardia sulfidoxydans NBRC 16205]|uniref:Aerotolerance regulator BatA n=1 Tax=Pseudonocardia sulfidoxydans NBRC 16205 TaxID=1223511 RepID=A0A511DG61_9PSEU|nr:VWA domain-containing protein [Pseudonocardia sulfidoxydans]GEL23775.1 aerotolerance regulator BatA [Pseudonocardia sulfidoxydans NBRC 16205]